MGGDVNFFRNFWEIWGIISNFQLFFKLRGCRVHTGRIWLKFAIKGNAGQNGVGRLSPFGSSHTAPSPHWCKKRNLLVNTVMQWKGGRRTQFRPKKVLKDCAIQLGSLLFQTFQVSVPLDLQGKDQYGSIVNSFLSSSPYVLHFDSQCTFFRCFSSYQYWSTLSKLCFVVSSAWERGSTIHIPILINCNPDKEWSIVP
jgi:hypothetical protein